LAQRNRGGVIVKVNPFPPNRGIGESGGANKVREQANGVVEVIEKGS